MYLLFLVYFFQKSFQTENDSNFVPLVIKWGCIDAYLLYSNYMVLWLGMSSHNDVQIVLKIFCSRFGREGWTAGGELAFEIKQVRLPLSRLENLHAAEGFFFFR